MTGENSHEVRSVDFGGGIIARIFCPNERVAMRADAALAKEPDTIAWLSGLDSEAVLWDVGANIGMYTLYGALVRRCRVVAFEPSAANYMNLNRNIEINSLSDRVAAYCVAVAERGGFDLLYLPDTGYGEALSNFGSATDFRGNPFEPAFRQGAVGFSLDELSRTSLPFPTHLKIDVDGLESEIIQGGKALFADTRVRSAIVEFDLARPRLVQEAALVMKSLGFRHANEGDDGGNRAVINARFERP